VTDDSRKKLWLVIRNKADKINTQKFKDTNTFSWLDQYKREIESNNKVVMELEQVGVNYLVQTKSFDWGWWIMKFWNNKSKR
jgi:hypothetical protein